MIKFVTLIQILRRFTTFYLGRALTKVIIRNLLKT